MVEQNVGKLVQNLRKIKMLGKIKEVICVSKIPLSKDWDNNIRECFVDKEMDFKYPNNIDQFDGLLDYFQRQKAPHKENYLGPNIKLIRLADKSETFANFLTVSGKFGLTCVY